MAENSIGMQHIDNLYQDNRETITKLTESYEVAIQNLKEEVAFLREMVKKNDYKA